MRHSSPAQLYFNQCFLWLIFWLLPRLEILFLKLKTQWHYLDLETGIAGISGITAILIHLDNIHTSTCSGIPELFLSSSFCVFNMSVC